MKSEIWNVPTLRSREIIEHGLDLNSLKTPLVRSPTKQKKKSIWSKVKSVMTCTTTQQYTVTVTTAAESESELTRLNELRLLTLSYEAEMTELKDEICRLTKERTKLRVQRRKMKEAPPPSPTHSIAQSSSSGFSEMSTPPSLSLLRPMSLASTMQRLEDAKILYIC